MRMFRTACAEQNLTGCEGLGAAYEHGWGTPPDEAKALDFYDRACRLYQVTACREARRLRGQ